MYCLSLSNIVYAIAFCIILKLLMKRLGCGKKAESFAHEDLVGAEIVDVYKVEPTKSVKFETSDPRPAFDDSLNLVPKETAKPEIIQSTMMPMTPDAIPDEPSPVDTAPSKKMGVMPLQGELGLIATVSTTPAPTSMALSPATPAPTPLALSPATPAPTPMALSPATPAPSAM